MESCGCASRSRVVCLICMLHAGAYCMFIWGLSYEPGDGEGVWLLKKKNTNTKIDKGNGGILNGIKNGPLLWGCICFFLKIDKPLGSFVLRKPKPKSQEPRGKSLELEPSIVTEHR